jgi:hypothetical protein
MWCQGVRCVHLRVGKIEKKGENPRASARQKKQGAKRATLSAFSLDASLGVVDYRHPFLMSSRCSIEFPSIWSKESNNFRCPHSCNHRHSRPL